MRRTALLLTLLLVAGACTTTGTAPDGVQDTSSTPVVPAGDGLAESTTVATAPPILVDHGVGVESAVISIGLVDGRPADFVNAYAAYWNSLNERGGIGGFSVEVAAVTSVAEAAGLDLLAITALPDAPPAAVVPVVADLITPSVGRVLASGHVLELILAGANPAEIRMIVDETSPDACRSVPWTVVSADESVLDAGDVAVLCTDPQTSAALLTGAGEFTAVSILARAWDPSLVDLVVDRPVEVIGVLPGPGVDDAPAGELLAAVLGDAPWSTDALAGYAAARSMHAVIEAALAGADLRRSAVTAAIDAAATLDFGFGQGIAAGHADASSPTGVRVEAIYPEE